MRENDIPVGKDQTGDTLRFQGWTIVLAALSVLTVPGLVRSLFVGLDVDESYAVAISYRLARGERLLRDLWEPHQFSGIFFFPFVSAYLHLTGQTTGIVVFGRIAGLIVHILVGFCVLRTLRGRVNGIARAFLFLLYLNFLPKWIQSPEFELLQYWFLMLQFACLYRAYSEKRSAGTLLVLAGALMLARMLCYPTLAIVYPVLCISIWILSDQRARDLSLFTLGTVIPGAALLLYLRSYQTLPEILSHLKRLASDPSHSIPLALRLGTYARDFVPILLLTAALVLLVRIAPRLFRGAHGLPFSSASSEDIGMILALAAMCVLSLSQICGLLLSETANQFYQSWRFFSLSCLGCMALRRPFQSRQICHFLLLPAFASFAGILLMTNMDLNTTLSKCFPALFGICLIFAERISPRDGAIPPDPAKRLLRQLFPAALLLLSVSLLLCRLGFVRVTGLERFTIGDEMEMIEDGPAKGVWMPQELAEALREDFGLLTGLLTSEDSMLYIGQESLVYLWTDAGISGASTLGTAVFNEMFIDYLNEHPEKYPTVVVVDKDLWNMSYYYNSEWNIVLLNWIEEWFPYEDTIETGHLILYRTSG